MQRGSKKNPQFLPDRTQKKLGIKGTYLNVTKAVYDRHYTKWEKTRAFLLKPRIRKGSRFFSLINTEKAVRQGKREKGVQIGKKSGKVFGFSKML